MKLLVPTTPFLAGDNSVSGGGRHRHVAPPPPQEFDRVFLPLTT